MRIAATLLISLAACTTFPELDGTLPANQSYDTAPDLIPLAPLVEQARAATYGAAEAETSLTARLANLRARAAGLRGPVIPPSQRARMQRSVR